MAKARKAKNKPARITFADQIFLQGIAIREVKTQINAHEKHLGTVRHDFAGLCERMENSFEKRTDQIFELIDKIGKLVDSHTSKIESLERKSTDLLGGIRELHSVLSAAQEQHEILRRRIYALESATPEGQAAAADKRIQAIEARTADSQKRAALIEEHIRRYYDGLSALDPSTRVARIERQLWPQDPYCGQEGRSPRPCSPGNGQQLLPGIMPPHQS